VTVCHVRDPRAQPPRKFALSGGALPSRITAASVSIASCVSTRAAVLTVTKICLAAIVSGRRGRPFGLPDTPGLKLVERLPPRGIA
jgi:hypothetical protein